jgi:hypothetical protein
MSTTPEQVKAVLDQLAALAESFTVNVKTSDFGTWLNALGWATFSVGLRGDDGDTLHAHTAGRYNGRYVQIHTEASGIDGHQVPTRDAKRRCLHLRPARPRSCGDQSGNVERAPT